MYVLSNDYNRVKEAAEYKEVLLMAEAERSDTNNKVLGKISKREVENLM